MTGRLWAVFGPSVFPNMRYCTYLEALDTLAKLGKRTHP